MQEFVNIRRRDHCSGILMLVIGLGAVIEGVRYNVGSLSDMGPGFFPVAVGTALAGTGVTLVGIATFSPALHGKKKLAPEWKAWICILASIVAFIVLGTFGGLLPASFAIVFISALGDRKNTLRKAVMLATGMTIFCVVVFWWALQLQFPLFQWG